MEIVKRVVSPAGKTGSMHKKNADLTLFHLLKFEYFDGSWQTACIQVFITVR